MMNKIIENTERKERKKEKNDCDSGTGLGVNLESGNELFFGNKIVFEYIPTRLAASILGISENALRIKVCRGEIPVCRLGRSLRFRVAEIVGLLKIKE